MKTPIIVYGLCVCLLAPAVFAQMTGGSLSIQAKGASLMMSPDQKSFTCTATFGPPVMFPMVIPGAPFSAEEIGSQTQVLLDGNRVTHVMPSAFLYRDSYGRTRTERPVMPMSANSALTSKIPLIPEIYDPLAGYQYFLDAAKRVAHRYAIPAPATMPARGVGPGTGAIRLSPGPEASGPAFAGEPLGTQMIDGILAEGHRTKLTFPAGAANSDQPIVNTTEYWNSVDLKVTVLSKTTDPRSGESLRALINVDRTEPDPSLFQVPQGYKVVDETGPFTITITGSAQ